MTKKLVFESEDFEALGRIVLNNKKGGFLTDAAFAKEKACQLANAKFDAWLAEQAVVYGIPERNWSTEYREQYNGPKDTHRALLINIEPLAPKVKCEQHEPTTKDTRQIISQGAAIDNLLGCTVVCRKCGTKLSAVWKESDEE